MLTSADGTRWSATSDKAFESANQADTIAATSGPAGYVVVGDDGRSAAVWHSADLKTWDRGAGTTKDAMDGTPGAERWMHSIVSGPFGYVAVGGLNDPSGQNAPTGRPAVWTSADGEKWALQQLPVPSGATEATFQQVAIEQNILTAAGTAKTASGTTVFAFTSADGGKTWKRAAVPRAGPGLGGHGRRGDATGFRRRRHPHGPRRRRPGPLDLAERPDLARADAGRDRAVGRRRPVAHRADGGRRRPAGDRRHS